jgi:hypothetical protein
MSYLIIVLAIIVVLLIYYIYTKITATPTVGDNIDLTQPPVVIKSSTITNPYSASYTIGVWVYVSNFDTTTNNIGDFLKYEVGTTSKMTFFSLVMDQNVPTLKCKLLLNSGNSGTPSEPKTQDITITSENERFPIQQWVYVVVSVSSTFVECYLNGRFVSATRVSSRGLKVSTPLAGEDPEAGPTFKFGARGTTNNGVSPSATRTNGCPVVLTGLSRWDSPQSAGDIYNNYMKGNGYNSNIFGSYHMDINLKKNKDNYKVPIF